jgi:hypothetical protein
VKRYWEIIADNLSKAGWSWGYVSAIDSNRRTIWIADAFMRGQQRFYLPAHAFVIVTSFIKKCGALLGCAFEG